ncbi:SusC/RagA family TonB-linked outer membrane protein [Flavicella sp.]|uniref:SusC/RagA family TonB-linked outer membrane protein n=1 Tax=Flavicella sp. TaxID=2957742 RepID=UPI00301988EE
MSTLVLLCATSAFGIAPNTILEEKQQFEIQQQFTGTVTDINGQPIPGVNVLEIGTTNGTLTDFNGAFSIQPLIQNATLSFSYIGYATKKLSINNKNNVNIVLEEDISYLDEVIVVGFGTQKSSKIVSSVSQITSKELKIDQRPVTNIGSALIGAVPGLMLTNSSGGPGSTPSIQIRGTSTLDSDAELLVIIDNFEGSLADIDPQTIESVSVLKDASAVAIYGARGANGVLLITTKNTSRNKKTSISYNFSSSIQSKPELPGTLNSLEYMQFQNQVVEGTHDQTVLDLASSGFYPETNWGEELYQNTAVQQSHNLTLTGGSENTGFLMSASYLTQDGLAIGDDYYERLNLRLKIDTDITDWFSTGVNALISNTTDNNVQAVTGSSLRGLPFYPIQTEDGMWVSNGTSDAGANAVATAASGSFDKTITDRVNLQLYAQFRPIKGLTIEERVSIIRTNSDNKDWDNTFSIVSLDYADPDSYTNLDSENRSYMYATTGGRTLSVSSFTQTKIRTLTSATYETEKGNHYMKAFVAMQTESGESDYFMTGSSDFLLDDIISLGQGAIIDVSIGDYGNYEFRGGNQTTLSYLGRLNYSYSDKYLFEATIRADASSYFLSENQWGYFPSVAVGWVASKENFLKDVDFVNILKLRASYGSSGDDSGLGSVTQQLVNLNNAGYPLGGQSNSALYVPSFVNPSLIWETSTVFNIGVDASLFNGKLHFEADHFRNKRTDIISLIKGTAFEYGFGDAQGNPYDVDSWGWELMATHRNKIGDFGYSISGNINIYDNEISYIQENATDPNFQVGQSVNDRFGYETDGFFANQEEIDSNVASDGTSQINQTGVGDAYIGGYKYVDQLTIDTNGDGVMDASDGIINSDDRVILDDNSASNLMFGFNVGFSYKNLSLSARFYGTFDNKQWLNANNSVQPFLGAGVPYSYMTDVWSTTNTDALFAKPTDIGPLQPYNANISHLLIDSEYIKLQNITLNYDFDKTILDKVPFVKSMNMYVSAENLGVIWTNSPLYDNGWDPELGVSAVRYPLPFTTAIGLNIKF